MSAAGLLDTAGSLGITLVADGDGVTYDAPDTAQAQALLARLSDHRDEVRDEVRRRAADEIHPTRVWPAWRTMSWDELLRQDGTALVRGLRYAAHVIGCPVCWQPSVVDGMPVLGRVEQ